MTIQTIDELLDFIEANFDKLSNKANINICSAYAHLPASQARKQANGFEKN